MKPVQKNAVRSLESNMPPHASSILSSLSTSSSASKFTYLKDQNHVRSGGNSRQSASALSTITTRNKNSMFSNMEMKLKEEFNVIEDNDVVQPPTTAKPKIAASSQRPKSPHNNKSKNFIEKNRKQIQSISKKNKDDSLSISPTPTIKQQRSSPGQSSFNNAVNIASRSQQQPSAGILKDTVKNKDVTASKALATAATRRPSSPQTFNHSKPSAHERSHVRAATPDNMLREENKSLHRKIQQHLALLAEKDNDIADLEDINEKLMLKYRELLIEVELLRSRHECHETNGFNNNNNDNNGSSPALLIMSSIKQNNKRIHGDQADNDNKKVDDNTTIVANNVSPLSSPKTTTVTKSPAASIISAHTKQPQQTKITPTIPKSAANTAAPATFKSTITATRKNVVASTTPVVSPNQSRGISLLNRLNNNIKPSDSMSNPPPPASSFKSETPCKTLIHGKKTAADLNIVMEDTDDSEEEENRFIFKNGHGFNLNNNAASKNFISTTNFSSDDHHRLDNSSDSDTSTFTTSSDNDDSEGDSEGDSEDDNDENNRSIEKFNNKWGFNAASLKSDFIDEVYDTSSNDEFDYEPPSTPQNKLLNKINLANSTTSYSNNKRLNSTTSVVSTSTKSNSLATSSNTSSDNKPKKRNGIRRQNALTTSNSPNKNKLNNNNNGQSVKKSSQNLNSTSKNNDNNGKIKNGLNQKQNSDSKTSKMVSNSSYSSSLATSTTDYYQKSNQTHRDSLSNKSDSLSDDSSSSSSTSSTQNGSSSSVTSPSTAYTTSSCNSIGKSFNGVVNNNNYSIQTNLANSNNLSFNSTYDSLTSANNNNDSITSDQQFNSTQSNLDNNSTSTSTTFMTSTASPKITSSQIDNNSNINSGHFSSQNSSYVSTSSTATHIFNKNHNLVSSSRQNSFNAHPINHGSIHTSTTSNYRVQSPNSVLSSRVSTPSYESYNHLNNNNNSNLTASSVISPPPPPENKDTLANLQHFLRHISDNSQTNKDPKDFYKLKQVIDEGSSAQVFTAHSLDTNEECAIKVIPLHYSLEFIFNEIFILKNYKHQNIVDFKESFVKWDGKTREVWLAMEKCARGDVTSRAGKVNEREVSRIAHDLLQALKHLHHHGVIHRDIKLSNILSCANNDVKLADFGISSLTPTSTTAMVGTIPYMAPDVVLVGPDRPYNTKVDVWSLGVCILELLTGKAAWGRIRDDEILDKLRRGEMPYGFQRLRKKADIGWEVVDFLEKCFVKNPENRWDAERLLEHPFITNCC